MIPIKDKYYLGSWYPDRLYIVSLRVWFENRSDERATWFYSGTYALQSRTVP